MKATIQATFPLTLKYRGLDLASAKVSAEGDWARLWLGDVSGAGVNLQRRPPSTSRPKTSLKAEYKLAVVMIISFGTSGLEAGTDTECRRVQCLSSARCAPVLSILVDAMIGVAIGLSCKPPRHPTTQTFRLTRHFSVFAKDKVESPAKVDP